MTTAPPPPLDRRTRLGLIGLGLVAWLLLGLGAWEPTGLTGKDEYYLGLRTPLCMIEQDRWWVPCLDGAPRIRKPPLVYWLTAAAFAAFGPSLAVARALAAAWGAGLVLLTVLVAWELGGDHARARLAGLLMLSFLGLGVGARMVELDVPVATCSLLAFWALLRWYRRDHPAWLGVAALGLAAGFLVKGPVVAVVCGAGGLALLALDPRARRFVAARRLQALAGLLLAVALALPWFLYVHIHFPDLARETLGAELAARAFLNPSLVPVYGILMLALPWSFVVLERLSIRRGPAQPQRALALLWLGLTLAPFFLIKTFERYLYGSLPALALWLAFALDPSRPALRWAARLGALLTLVLGLPLAGLAWWLSGFAWGPAFALAALGGLAWVWWRPGAPQALALSAALAWSALLGLAYPRLGINAIPPALLALTRHAPVVLYGGPQPALLPIVLGRSLIHLDPGAPLPRALLGDCRPILVTVPGKEVREAAQALTAAGLRVRERGRFGILSADVTWYRMFRERLGRAQILRALAERRLDRLAPRVVVLEAGDSTCGAP